MQSQNYKKFDDPKLVALCLQGDSSAWETLIIRYRRLIYSIPSRFGFSYSDCSDVFQAVCLRFIENLAKLKDDTKVSAWLITTTTRKCIQVRAEKYREPSHGDDEIAEREDPGDDVETIRIQSQRDQGIRDTINEMPERCRKLLELLYFDAQAPTYETIAKILNIPVASVGPTRIRCLEKLRIMLRKRGIH